MRPQRFAGLFATGPSPHFTARRNFLTGVQTHLRKPTARLVAEDKRTELPGKSQFNRFMNS